MLELDRKGILAVTMPCFGTTARTKGNAEKLAEAYGVTLKTVDIKAAVDQHFMDIGQSKDDLSVTFENGQARMRTLVLMNLANKNGGHGGRHGRPVRAGARLGDLQWRPP